MAHGKPAGLDATVRVGVHISQRDVPEPTPAGHLAAKWTDEANSQLGSIDGSAEGIGFRARNLRQVLQSRMSF